MNLFTCRPLRKHFWIKRVFPLFLLLFNPIPLCHTLCKYLRCLHNCLCYIFILAEPDTPPEGQQSGPPASPVALHDTPLKDVNVIPSSVGEEPDGNTASGGIPGVVDVLAGEAPRRLSATSLEAVAPSADQRCPVDVDPILGLLCSPHPPRVSRVSLD